MDCGCVNTGISIYFQCRILAAKNNVYLKSRESAAEYFGISVSSLANYERGVTVPPGFFLFLFMGSALDGPEWKIPLVGAIIGVAIMKIGVVIARMEGSEYV